MGAYPQKQQLCCCAAKLLSATTSQITQKLVGSPPNPCLFSSITPLQGQPSIKRNTFFLPPSFPFSHFWCFCIFLSGFPAVLPTPQNRQPFSLYLRALCLFLPALFHLEDKHKHAENLSHHPQQLRSRWHFALLEVPPVGAAVPFSAHFRS